MDERLEMVSNLMVWEMAHRVEREGVETGRPWRMAVVVRPPAGLPQDRQPLPVEKESIGSASTSTKPAPAKLKLIGFRLRRV